MAADPTRPERSASRQTGVRPGAERPRVVRWLYGGLGLLLVGLGVLGAVLPGLPTTVFLLGATWCFARSFPHLSERLLGARLFRPFRAWIVPGGRVSRRAKAGALLTMWAAITLSVHLFLAARPPRWVWAGVVVALGGIGTWFVVRHGGGRGIRRVGTEKASV